MGNQKQIDVGAVISQAMELQADCTTSTRQLTALLSQAVTELERVSKELSDLKSKTE